MPRKGPAVRRELMPDPVYHSVLVTQVVNRVLSRGKRTLAERIVYAALADVAEKTGNDPVSVLKKAVENTRPELEVRSRRVGGATYQVPVEVRPRRAGQGPPGGPVQGHPGHPRRVGGQGAQPGAEPLRRQEGVLTCPAKVPQYDVS